MARLLYPCEWIVSLHKYTPQRKQHLIICMLLSPWFASKQYRVASECDPKMHPQRKRGQRNPEATYGCRGGSWWVGSYWLQSWLWSLELDKNRKRDVLHLVRKLYIMVALIRKTAGPKTPWINNDHPVECHLDKEGPSEAQVTNRLPSLTNNHNASSCNENSDLWCFQFKCV